MISTSSFVFLFNAEFVIIDILQTKYQSTDWKKYIVFVVHRNN